MTAFLPPNLLALFAPRDPLPFIPVPDRAPHCVPHPYTGVGQFLSEFEDPKDTPPPTRVETKDERKERKNKERAEQVAYKLEQDLALWDPHTDSQATTDPFKTLFVARVNFDTSESKLRREFEVYGPIKHIRLVTNVESDKPRGYAFIEYEHERDMHSAYKHADGKKIDSRRVLVDVERARTVKGWRPRRLGGGLGSTRKGGADVNSRFSGRDDGTGNTRSRTRSPDSRRPARRRSRSREREPRRRSRERKKRSRSRERGGRGGGRDDEDRRKRRSRSRDRAKRSRSRERKRNKRSSHSRERSERQRSRSGERERFDDETARDENGSGEGPDVSARKVEPEPDDDATEYGTYGDY